LQDFQAKAPPLSAKGIDGRGIQEVWITQLYNLRLNLQVRATELEGRVAALEAAIKEGRGRQVLMVQLTSSVNRPGSILGSASATNGSELGRPNERKPDEQLFGLELKEKQLLAEYGKDHPLVLAVQKQMELTRDYFAPDKAAREKARDLGVVDPVQWHLQAMKQELADVRVSLAALTRLINDEQKDVGELIRYRSQEQDYEKEVEYARKTLEPAIQRWSEIRQVRDLGGFDAEVIAPPQPGVPIGPFIFNYLVLGGFFGMLSGLGLAYVADMRDKTFRTPEEIRRRLGLPIIGHIPVLHADAATAENAKGIGLDPYLCTFLQPKSTQAEAFRGVRTALYFSVRGEVHQVIQVTSPNASDGKSTVIANLAISIAQSGKRVVLVDADFRKPRQHKMFGVSPTTGVASVMTDQAELKDAILETAIPGLSLLPCGPRPDNPAELLTSPRFKELIDVIREQFDYVLIDTPPLLAVSDPSVVAPRVDGVILAVRVSVNGRPAAERAKEILSTLNTKVVGVVVNGVGGGPNRYGYDSYGGYGYSYGYQYQYAYQYSSDYYQEEEAAADGAGADGKGETTPAAPPAPAERKRRSEKKQPASKEPAPKEGLLARLWPWGR
jgi:capsular exopolysaccharide synthesis family protein